MDLKLVLILVCSVVFMDPKVESRAITTEEPETELGVVQSMFSDYKGNQEKKGESGARERAGARPGINSESHRSEIIFPSDFFFLLILVPFSLPLWLPQCVTVWPEETTESIKKRLSTAWNTEDRSHSDQSPR